MSTQNEYITIKEASYLTGKWNLTIRRLIKNKKIKYKMINHSYTLNKDELNSIYPFIKEKKEDNKIQNDDIIINQSIQEHIKPLLDNILYYQEENKKYQRLLTDWNNTINEKEKLFELQIEKYKYKIKLLLWLIIVLIIILILYLSISKGFLVINI